MAKDFMAAAAIEEQMFLAKFIPTAGLMQLPVGQPPLESKKGKK